MSRLRRLQVTGKTFFITCNLLPVRTQLTKADFEALASAIVRVRGRRGFLLTGYVFMPDHWHVLIIAHERFFRQQWACRLLASGMFRLTGSR